MKLYSNRLINEKYFKKWRKKDKNKIINLNKRIYKKEILFNLNKKFDPNSIIENIEKDKNSNEKIEKNVEMKSILNLKNKEVNQDLDKENKLFNQGNYIYFNVSNSNILNSYNFSNHNVKNFLECPKFENSNIISKQNIDENDLKINSHTQNIKDDFNLCNLGLDNENYKFNGVNDKSKDSERKSSFEIFTNNNDSKELFNCNQKLKKKVNNIQEQKHSNEVFKNNILSEENMDRKKVLESFNLNFEKSKTHSITDFVNGIKENKKKKNISMLFPKINGKNEQLISNNSSEKFIKFSKLEFLNLYFCCQKFKAKDFLKKENIFRNAESKICNYLDIFNFLNLNEDFEKLKMIIFNNYQYTAFGLLRKRTYKEIMTKGNQEKIFNTIKYFRNKEGNYNDYDFELIKLFSEDFRRLFK